MEAALRAGRPACADRGDGAGGGADPGRDCLEGERCEGSGRGEPAGEVGFEGELVVIAVIDGFATLLLHDVVMLKEYLGGVEEAVYMLLPSGIAVGL